LTCWACRPERSTASSPRRRRNSVGRWSSRAWGGPSRRRKGSTWNWRGRTRTRFAVRLVSRTGLTACDERSGRRARTGRRSRGRSVRRHYRQDRNRRTLVKMTGVSMKYKPTSALKSANAAAWHISEMALDWTAREMMPSTVLSKRLACQLEFCRLWRTARCGADQQLVRGGRQDKRTWSCCSWLSTVA